LKKAIKQALLLFVLATMVIPTISDAMTVSVSFFIYPKFDDLSDNNEYGLITYTASKTGEFIQLDTIYINESEPNYRDASVSAKFTRPIKINPKDSFMKFAIEDDGTIYAFGPSYTSTYDETIKEITVDITNVLTTNNVDGIFNIGIYVEGTNNGARAQIKIYSYQIHITYEANDNFKNIDESIKQLKEIVVDGFNTTLQTIASINDTLGQINNDLTTKITNISNDINFINQTTIDINQSINETNDRMGEFEQNLVNLVKEVENINKTINATFNYTVEIENRTVAYQQTLANIESALETIQIKMDEIQGCYDTLQQSITNITVQLDNVMTTIQTIVQKIDDITSNITELLQSTDNIKNDIKNVNNEMAQLVSDLMENITKTEQRILSNITEQLIVFENDVKTSVMQSIYDALINITAETLIVVNGSVNGGIHINVEPTENLTDEQINELKNITNQIYSGVTQIWNETNNTARNITEKLNTMMNGIEEVRNATNNTREAVMDINATIYQILSENNLTDNKHDAMFKLLEEIKNDIKKIKEDREKQKAMVDDLLVEMIDVQAKRYRTTHVPIAKLGKNGVKYIITSEETFSNATLKIDADKNLKTKGLFKDIIVVAITKDGNKIVLKGDEVKYEDGLLYINSSEEITATEIYVKPSIIDRVKIFFSTLLW